MRRDTKQVMCALAFALCGASRLAAQVTDSTGTSRDSIIARARQLADSGNAADARKLLDSVLKTITPDSARYADVLYWRGALASAAVDAERDYRRLLIEAPLSRRAEDALLQLAQLEQARGDRKGATDHLQRFMLEYPKNAARPRVAVSLVRLLMDQGLVARGCEALKTGRTAIPAENLELRNQLEFYAPRCVTLEATPAPAADSVSVAGGAADTIHRPASDTARKVASATIAGTPAKLATAPPSSATGASFYSVQVAAYDSREAAIRMSRVLRGRGLEARVDGTTRPYRVRIGKYTTRAEAAKAATTLKSQGISGFVTLVKG